MTFQMINDDEWLARLRELIGDDDCVLGGNLVRMPEEEVERILSSQMINDDEWLKRQRDLIGDDDCVLDGNLVRIPSEDSGVTDTVR